MRRTAEFIIVAGLFLAIAADEGFAAAWRELRLYFAEAAK